MIDLLKLIYWKMLIIPIW